MERRRSKSGQDTLWRGQDRDWIRREACPRCVAGLELALEDERREGQLLFGQAELCAKEDFSRPASGQCHERHALVAVVGEKRDSFLNEGSGSW